MNKSALAAAIFITFSAFSMQEIFRNSAETAFAARVIDGDTFETEGGDGVRLLGINTPERGQPLYGNASAFLKGMIEGRNITMERDRVEKDKYGRKLRYVFIGGVFVNEEIMRKGLANIYIILPNEKYSARFIEAEQHARESGLGLWEADAEYKDCVSVSEFNWDAAENDNENLNSEHVSFRNRCSVAVNMTGWTLKNSGRIIYKFGKIFIGANQTVKIYSGCGNNTENELFWCGKKPVWSNSGDALYLRNSEGLLVLSESYEGKAE